MASSLSPLSQIRNFSIIAHIDHGKSTLADRILERCGAFKDYRHAHDQFLDQLKSEKERGITIKAQTCSLSYTDKKGDTYELNLIDTPGHVDFAYEVGRSLAACEGSLLVVDATQGVEAQTLSNVYQAIDHHHEIIPILNKIDLPAAEPDRVCQDIESIIGLDTSGILHISAKMGLGIEDVLEAIIHRLPPPQGDRTAPLKALLIDSWYDNYLGVVMLIRVYDGVLKKNDTLSLMSLPGSSYTVTELGKLTPFKVPCDALLAGQVGYVVTGIKSLADCRIGDTITDKLHPTTGSFPGFKAAVPMVFCSLFPSDPSEYETVRDGLLKLQLNDASFSFEPDSSVALGAGFRCGFLGLLHLEIIQERLSDEFNVDLIPTAPSVAYRIQTTDGIWHCIHNPADMPLRTSIAVFEEPWIRGTIFSPIAHVGTVMALCNERRGIQENLEYKGERAILTYALPLNEVIFDFFDALKSLSHGYASFDYEQNGYREGDLVKVNILVNGEASDALAFMTHRHNSEKWGRDICETLKDLIPRQLFKIALQAVIDGKVIARETISPLRKDVTAKCYGGDISRKRKLLEKQKEGKKRMRSIGDVDIPHHVFIQVLRRKS
jgi:GTP-binding protein LepA